MQRARDRGGRGVRVDVERWAGIPSGGRRHRRDHGGQAREQEALEQPDAHVRDLPHHPEAAGGGTGDQQPAVHARQPDRVETGGAQLGDDLPVHRAAQHELHHLRDLGRRDAQAVPLLDGEAEPAAQRADRAPAAVYHDHGIEAHQRPGAAREPAGAIELVAAQLHDPGAQHTSPAVSGRPSITFMF